MTHDHYKCFQRYQDDFCSPSDFLCQAAKSYAYFSNCFPTASALFVESHWVLAAQGEKESVAGDSGGITIGLRIQTPFSTTLKTPEDLNHCLYSEGLVQFGPEPVWVWGQAASLSAIEGQKLIVSALFLQMFDSISFISRKKALVGSYRLEPTFEPSPQINEQHNDSLGFEPDPKWRCLPRTLFFSL
jgi:hypothetical protein